MIHNAIGNRLQFIVFHTILPYFPLLLDGYRSIVSSLVRLICYFILFRVYPRTLDNGLSW